MNVAALFVDAAGVYPRLLGRELCWAETDDARLYCGELPVVAHPPCARWCNLAPWVFKRTGKEEHRPAWLGGDDGGCFASALASVRKFGGVLEHPAGSHAWAHHKLGTIPLDFELNWAREPGTHTFDGYAGDAKPPLSKRERSATPEPFARELLRLAAWSRP
jgi:hypothetical protein